VNLKAPKPPNGLYSMSKGLKPIEMKVHNSIKEMRHISKAAEINGGNFLSNEEILAMSTPRDDDL